MQAKCLVESEFGKSVLYLVSKLPVDKKSVTLNCGIVFLLIKLSFKRLVLHQTFPF